MIGADFEKIQFVLAGYDLVEPMALIMDTVMGSLSVYFGIKVLKLKSKHPFYLYWAGFFLIFGTGAMYGGLTHSFYNYWGYLGKIPQWLAGPVSLYFLEQAMITVHPSRKALDRLKLFSFWKLIIVLVGFTLIVTMADLVAKPGLGFLPIAINTIIGVSTFAGILGMYYYRKKLSINYKYFALGVLIMLPSSVVFLAKINLHPWFDKNDLSHVLLITGITYFYLGVDRKSVV